MDEMIYKLSKWARENFCGDYTPRTKEDWQKLALNLRHYYNSMIPYNDEGWSRRKNSKCVEVLFDFDFPIPDLVLVHKKYVSSDDRVYWGQPTTYSMKELSNSLKWCSRHSVEELRKIYEGNK